MLHITSLPLESSRRRHEPDWLDCVVEAGWPSQHASMIVEALVRKIRCKIANPKCDEGSFMHRRQPGAFNAGVCYQPWYLSLTHYADCSNHCACIFPRSCQSKWIDQLMGSRCCSDRHNYQDRVNLGSWSDGIRDVLAFFVFEILWPSPSGQKLILINFWWEL